MSTNNTHNSANSKLELDCSQLKVSGYCEKGSACPFVHKSSNYKKVIYLDNITASNNNLSDKLDQLLSIIEKQSQAITLQCVAIANLSKHIAKTETKLDNVIRELKPEDI